MTDPITDPITDGTLACIPSIGRSEYLYELVEVLVGDGIPVHVWVNQPGVRLIDQLSGLAFTEHRRPKASIYEEWNMAARKAKEAGYGYMLVCNDDITMLPGTVRALVDALADTNWAAISVGETEPVVHPTSLTATSHAAGTRRAFLQWCFLVRLEAWQDVDPRYQIWYGDDDLLLKLEGAGWRYGALHGVGVRHHTSTTLNQTDWVNAAIADDIALWTKERGG